VENYRTEEEQLESLRRWWDDNGRSTIAAVVIALAVGVGWQGWKGHRQEQREAASDLYQSLLQNLGDEHSGEPGGAAAALAGQLKADFGGSTYAQFAALQLARLAVERKALDEAEAELRWVLGHADQGSDTARVARLRLARVLAAAGEAEQALSILGEVDEGPYRASYALARGDILLGLDRREEARAAYEAALMLSAAQPGQLGSATLRQKLQSLSPVPPQPVDGAADAGSAPAGPASVEPEQAPAESGGAVPPGDAADE
jgi:predicted negative regulator of RcsB-dependent stress response